MGKTGGGTSNKKGKVLCGTCNKKCSGEVLKVHDQFFHVGCFKCKACSKSLAQGGFFTKNSDYFCAEDYQRQHGTRCAICGHYVEGEVVTALGNTYHQKCFLCARCRQPFPSGERVTFTGKECVCSKCVQIPVMESISPQHTPSRAGAPKCSGCEQDLNESQALIALEKPWHIWCFKCTTCQVLLHGEYMTREGKPYCEKHYQAEYGVKCAYCQRYISGKVLQAGDNHHFHPTCARCTKCGDPFGDGEEMYLQGAAIWHPRCGPGPTENGLVINGHDAEDSMANRSAELDRLSTTASETQFSFRSRSPSISGSGRISSQYRHASPYIDVTRIYTQSYLADGPSMGYLRRPIEPYDKPPKSPHFHRPPPSVGSSGRRMVFTRPGSRSGMQALVNQIESETPRPRSPYMNNEEPIELSHYPDAKKPSANDTPKIERDDFPGPPYPYTDPERRRRLSDKSSLHEADLDALDGTAEQPEDPKLKREEVELNKISSGIGKVFLEQVRDREKLRQYKMANVDPRNSSRAPNADHELPYRLRYESPIYASPSRDADHVRPWELDEEFERGGPYRSSLPGRAYGAVPNYRIVRSSMSAPRPGYGMKASTLPYAGGRPATSGGYYPDYYGGLGEKTHSTEFSSARSDISIGSLTEADRNALNQAEAVSVHTPRSGQYQYHYQFSGVAPMRRSLPNVSSQIGTVPLPAAKTYPAHLLMTTNYRLPADVDRGNLERHLSETEFEMFFRMPRADFYRLPLWRRNDLKKRGRLF